MSFLVISVVIFMLSSATAEYIDHSNGHVDIETTYTVGATQLHQRTINSTTLLITHKEREVRSHDLTYDHHHPASLH